MNKKMIPLGLAIFFITGVTLYFEVFRYWGDNGSVVEGNGTIEVTEIEVASRIPARVLSVAKEEGEFVSAGELVVRMAYDDLDAQRLSAVASLVNSEKNLKRIRDLFSTGSVSQKDLDNAEAAYRVARGQADYVSARISDAKLFAPVSGTVLEKNLEAGEMAFPGTPLLVIADLTRPWIKIYVPEKKIGLVKLGQKAHVSVDSYPGKRFEGTVTSIANKAEFTPRTIQTREERIKMVFAVKITLKNPGGELKPGMPADALIETGGSRD